MTAIFYLDKLNVKAAIDPTRYKTSRGQFFMLQMISSRVMLARVFPSCLNIDPRAHANKGYHSISEISHFIIKIVMLKEEANSTAWIPLDLPTSRA